MIIEIEDYRLIQEEITFNLFWVTKSKETIIQIIEGRRVRSKTGKLINKEVCLGYNMTLENCIKKIVMNNLNNKDLVIDLKTWIKMYREERDKITNLINNLI